MTPFSGHPGAGACERIGPAPSHLAPLAGRGRNPRVWARMPGEGQRRDPNCGTLCYLQEAPHPNPLPASGARENPAALIQPTPDEMGRACPPGANLR